MTFRFLVLLILVFSSVYSQETRTVIPNKDYKAGSLKTFFLGDHWRDLWTTPIKIPVLDLKKFGGGLTPIKRGGGMQTKSLRFAGKDGHIWKFRSLDKDPAKVLPEEIRHSVVADVLKDQISSANPAAPVVVATILDSLGIYNAKPYLCIMPDSPLLGEYKEEFGGLIGMLEIHPDEKSRLPFAGFGEVDKVSGTFKMFEKLENDIDEKVHGPSFLKARLADIFLGDWDRHTDQWRWAKIKNKKSEYWYPIPRDRDQAFAKFDGLGPTIAEYLVPQLVHFDYNYPQIEDLSWSGRFLDRRYLPAITKAEWDSVTSFVQRKLTNDLIESAVKKMPPELYPLAGEELIGKLKSRRDKLKKASDEYFRRINKYLDIYGTKYNDSLHVSRISDEYTSVRLWSKGKKNKKYKLIFERVFTTSITKEIRIYLEEGDDKAFVSGRVDDGILLRIIGGSGDDCFTDSSEVAGNFLLITPFYDAANLTMFYDSDKGTKCNPGAGTIIDTSWYPPPKDEFEKYEPPQRDRGHDWIISPYGSLNKDDGIVGGGSLALYKYNFRIAPFDYRLKITALYASKPQSVNLRFQGDFYNIIKGLLFRFDAYTSQMHYTDFFGYGNETRYNEDLFLNSEYYRKKQRTFSFKPSLALNLNSHLYLEGSLIFESNDVEINKSLIANFPSGGYGTGHVREAGAGLTVLYDNRDSADNPSGGFYWNTSAFVYPGIFDNPGAFSFIESDIRYYQPIKFGTDHILAMRAGGKNLWGEYPFFKSASIGGQNSLRGFNQERFAGDASLFSQVELRTYLSEIRFVLKGKLGFHLFAETGRVFAKNETSDLWHPSFGGGLWVTFFRNYINAFMTLGFSNESTTLYFDLASGF